jgi:hypothetical protein
MAKPVVDAPHQSIDPRFGRRPFAMDTVYFLLAVAAVSAIIFALMMRADRINRRRGSTDGGSSDTSVNDSSVASWFGPYGGGRRDW